MTVAGASVSGTQLGVRYNLDIKETGVGVAVRDDCRSRLMYYLNCVSGTSDYISDYPRFIKYTKYESYNGLTEYDEEELYHICSDIITLTYANRNGLKECDDDSLLKGNSNVFYDLTETNEITLNQIHLNFDENSSSIASRITGAKNETKTKVMFYTKDWINRNYHNALVDLSNRIENRKREKIEAEERRKREEEEKRKREEEEEKRRIETIRLYGKYVDKCCCCSIIVFEDVKYGGSVQCLLILYFILGIVLSFVSFFSQTYSSSLFYFISFCLAPVTCFIGLLLLIISCCCGLYIGSIRVFLKYVAFELLVNLIIAAIAFHIGAVVILLIMSLIMCALFSQTNRKTRCECDCCNV